MKKLILGIAFTLALFSCTKTSTISPEAIYNDYLPKSVVGLYDTVHYSFFIAADDTMYPVLHWMQDQFAKEIWLARQITGGYLMTKPSKTGSSLGHTIRFRKSIVNGFEFYTITGDTLKGYSFKRY